MASISGSVGRGGVNNRADVRNIQTLLNRYTARLGLAPLVVDGIVGPKTLGAIEAFQRQIAGFANPDGRVDPNGRILRALTGGPAGPVSPPPPPPAAGGGGTVPGAQATAAWPPRPAFDPLSENGRRQVFGDFNFTPRPASSPGQAITILGGWANTNIVRVNVNMGPTVGARRVEFHTRAAAQFVALWEAWAAAGLLDRVLSWSGSFVPRYKRRSTTSLSNHSWGTAFDINVPQNGMGSVPALVGQTGSVRELVPIANDHGFFWGGHFRGNSIDGMHFEVARIV